MENCDSVSEVLVHLMQDGPPAEEAFSIHFSVHLSAATATHRCGYRGICLGCVCCGTTVLHWTSPWSSAAGKTAVSQLYIGCIGEGQWICYVHDGVVALDQSRTSI